MVPAFKSTCFRALALLGVFFVQSGCGYEGGPAAASDAGQKLTDPGTSRSCEDGVLDDDELCDGDLFRDDMTCESLGYNGGTLACNDQCRGYDLSACEGSVCDDLWVSGDEDCEPALLGFGSCREFGYESGDLGCNEDCSYDFSSCVGGTCGNGIVDEGEECDRGPANGERCSDAEPECVECAEDCTIVGNARSIDAGTDGAVRPDVGTSDTSAPDADASTPTPPEDTGCASAQPRSTAWISSVLFIGALFMRRRRS